MRIFARRQGYRYIRKPDPAESFSAFVPLSQTGKAPCRSALPSPSGPFHLPQILSPSFLVHPWATPHQVSYARKQEGCD